MQARWAAMRRDRMKPKPAGSRAARVVLSGALRGGRNEPSIASGPAAQSLQLLAQTPDCIFLGAVEVAADVAARIDQHESLAVSGRLPRRHLQLEAPLDQIPKPR